MADITQNTRTAAGPTPDTWRTHSRVTPGVLWLILRESRLVVQVAYALRFVVGLSMAGATQLPSWRAGAAFFSWISVCVAIYALNGISDCAGDRVNRSTRPIASGVLPVRTAWRALSWIVLAGVAAAALAGPAVVVAFALMFCVGWAYSFGRRPLKNTVPGLLFSGTALGMLTYLAGWFAGGGQVPGPAATVCCGGLALWMGIVGTMTKDLGDVSGDRHAGRRTLPIMVGVSLARRIAALVALCFAVVFAVAVAWFAPGRLTAAIILLIGAVAVAGIGMYVPGPTGRNGYRAFMLTQYAANLAVLV